MGRYSHQVDHNFLVKRGESWQVFFEVPEFFDGSNKILSAVKTFK